MAIPMAGLKSCASKHFSNILSTMLCRRESTLPGPLLSCDFLLDVSSDDSVSSEVSLAAFKLMYLSMHFSVVVLVPFYPVLVGHDENCLPTMVCTYSLFTEMSKRLPAPRANTMDSSKSPRW